MSEQTPKSFNEFIKAEDQALTEGVISTLTWAIAREKAKDPEDRMEVLKLRDDPKTKAAAVARLAKIFGAKVTSDNPSKAVMKIGNNTSIQVTDSNYGDHVVLTLYVKEGLKEADAEQLAKALKSLKLF